MPVMNTELMARVRQVMETEGRHDQRRYLGVTSDRVPHAGLQASLSQLRYYALTDVPLVPRNKDYPICQTTGCVAGWAVVLAGPDDGKVPVKGWIRYVALPGEGIMDIPDMALELLGLTPEQGVYLFAESRSHDEVLWLLEWLPEHQDADYDQMELAAVSAGYAGIDDEDQ